MKSDFKTGASCAVLALAVLSLASFANAQSTSQNTPQPSTPLTNSNPPAPTPPSSKPGSTISEVVVTAQRLNEARASIQPQIGASVYTITDQAIKNMPGGDNVQLDQVILQAPGVAQDSYGQIHVRGEHNQLQYRINGLILPEGLSVFGQALDPRLIQNVQLITGALPAEYGLDTAGIIDITTKTGLTNGGSVTMYGGSRDEINPSAEYHGTFGTFNYFASISYMRNDLGIESPDGSADPLHDKTSQLHAFAYIQDVLTPHSSVALMAGTSDERFQIPDVANGEPTLGLSVGDPTGAPTLYPSQDLNENQRENTQFAALSYLYDNGRFTGQVSLMGRYTTLTFVPDELGDLLYNGIAQNARKSDTAGILQAEGAYRITDSHTIRGGIILEVDRSISDTSSQVLQTDAAGMQINGPPYEPITIVDDGAETEQTYSAYVQDEWKILSNLTLNYGLRFDQSMAYRLENQLSPRANLVWKVTPDTTFHMGYSRYFSPPPFELIGQETVNKFVNTSAASEVTQDTTPYAERANYYDVGVSQVFTRHLTMAVDTYFKESKDLIDEGQFGAPIVLTPFNYSSGRQYGIEWDATYTNGPLSAYANFAAQSAKGEHIVSSQFNFDADDLAYIADHYIDLDHSASYTASAGASYALPVWRGTRVGADALYGSGLRGDLTLPSGQVIPNGAVEPSYVQVNLTASHRFETAPGGPYVVRLDVINVANKIIELRDGSGVGVFAPQYGPRRGIFAGITKEF